MSTTATTNFTPIQHILTRTEAKELVNKTVQEAVDAQGTADEWYELERSRRDTQWALERLDQDQSGDTEKLLPEASDATASAEKWRMRTAKVEKLCMLTAKAEKWRMLTANYIIEKLSAAGVTLVSGDQYEAMATSRGSKAIYFGRTSTDDDEGPKSGYGSKKIERDEILAIWAEETMESALPQSLWDEAKEDSRRESALRREVLEEEHKLLEKKREQLVQRMAEIEKLLAE